ncbi:MAG TPA: bifunctional 2-methylcitrate dehydratase/aconitate hydratase [Chthoniobacterales bacterium]|nr:bifunctional 2-methylcitrate dehydratase/aconitate hydratase [Chthoniobacterales bacterium]
MHLDHKRLDPDRLLQEVADYVLSDACEHPDALRTARFCVLDSLGCALQALQYPACTKLLGPIVSGADCPGGSRVPGTSYQLDPVRAAFNIGTMIRWLDFNDTFLAAEWGHPSDNLGAILAVADYLGRKAVVNRGERIALRQVFAAAVQAHEIQGVLALSHSFNRVGLDHVLLVRVASAAVATRLLGGTREEIINALSHAFLDGGALRTYRHAPNTGSRKSWAAGDAASRGVFHAFQAIRGEMGYATALTAKEWGFQDVVYRGQPIALAQPLGSYVMRNVLFKISFPAEFHAQTAVEAAIQLHPMVTGRLDRISRIVVETQESGKRIIDKTGPLFNPADRDHCIQYMVAVPLIRGNLTAEDYEDEAAKDPRIDQLRSKMQVKESPQFSRDYLDPEKRSIGNSIQVFFADGSSTEKVTVEYPIGHPRRRAEGEPLLLTKFERNLRSRVAPKNADRILSILYDQTVAETTAMDDFFDLLVV